MKRLPLILLVLFAAILATRVIARSVPAPQPFGQYVEARSASVWCGPCHHAGEVYEMGRNGIAAWAFEGGEQNGYDLTGVKVVMLLGHSDQNLAELGAGPLESTRFIVDAPDATTARAARNWALLRARPVPNPRTMELVEARISFTRDGDFFRVASDGLFEVRGDAIADGSCCSQPENRWYETFDDEIDGLSIVGVPDVCEVTKQGALESWRHAGENNVQLASF
tara:strand:+ start:10168 stop:10839 length:672 start_codon:yes stop_codon:yes gene_type:complete